MISSNLTSHEDINQVITYLAQGISEILNENLIGIYLFGSLTYGDFNDESSDIDLVAILKNSASKVEINKLKELHKQVEDNYPKWAKRIESSYTPQQMLPSIMPPGARPYYGEGVFYAEAPYGNEWIINLYLLYNHGIAVVGPEFNQLVLPIKITDVQQSCIRDLFKEWEPKLRESEWLDNSHYQSYLVMNLCRILNTVVNATALSKKKSADWVKHEFPEWKELIQTAEEWHYGIEMKRNEQALDFLKFVIDRVNNFSH
jgi:predicted nucleotidyltransferase